MNFRFQTVQARRKKKEENRKLHATKISSKIWLKDETEIERSDKQQTW